jgi:hypothetical protein
MAGSRAPNSLAAALVMPANPFALIDEPSPRGSRGTELTHIEDALSFTSNHSIGTKDPELGTERTATEETATEETVAEETVAEEPVTEETVVEETTTEETVKETVKEMEQFMRTTEEFDPSAPLPAPWEKAP